LSTVFGIVRAHHGWLVVESQPKQGTTFRSYFPASRQAAEKTELFVDTRCAPVAKPSLWLKTKMLCAKW